MNVRRITGIGWILALGLWSVDGAAQEAPPPPEAPAPPDFAAQLEAQQKRLEAHEQRLEAQQKRLEAQEKALAQKTTQRESDAADAEIEALAADARTEASDPALDVSGGRPLRIYGFVDAGFNKLFVPKSSFLYPLTTTNAGTFVLGNANLFFDAQPHEEWRALLELRFTNAPHGLDEQYASPLGTEYARVNRRVTDASSPNARNEVPLGSLIIERAYVEWSPADIFNLQTGLFLTPFGIWNVDHGTPTLISLVLPDLQVDEYAPSRQLGLHAKGSVFPAPWELGYHLYVSNGRTPGEHDLTEDKAFGGRLFASYIGKSLHATVGASGYYGTYADVEKRIESFSPFVVEVDQTVDGQEWAAGVDLAVDIDDKVRLRTEGAMRRVSYETGQRQPVDDGPPGAVEADLYQLNAYVLAAYRLPWLGLEPYVWLEAIHRPSTLGDTVFIPSAGLNVHFTPEAQLKIQYAHITFHDTVTDSVGNPSDNDFGALVSRLVLAF